MFESLVRVGCSLPAGFHDDQVCVAILENAGKVFTPSVGGQKSGLSAGGGIKAANGVEFPEINGESLHCFGSLGFGGWSECDRQPHAAEITGPSRQFLDE